MGILGVALSLVVIVYLVRKHVNVGWAMVIGALIVSIFSKMTIVETLEAFKLAAISDTFIELALVVFLISLLGYIMKMTGSLDLMISSLVSILGGSKMLMMAIPSLIGLLTVPGGAILSAPMVGESGEKLGLGHDQKAAINIFFRHIWYPVYPLYPGLLLAARMTGVKVINILLLSLPVVLVSVYIANKTMFKGAVVIQRDKTVNKSIALLRLIQSMLPLVVTLILAIGFKVSFPKSVIVGIIMALFNLVHEDIFKTVGQRIRTMILPGINFKMVVSVFGIMVFREVLEASAVLSDFMTSLVELGLPIGVLAVFATLVAGLVTGSNTAALGIAVPIFLPLITHNPLPYVILIFIASLLGYVLSPLHLCLILTKDFFKCQYKEMYRYFLKPVIAMGLTTTAIFFILYLL